MSTEKKIEWTSRKFWLFVVSLTIGTVAAFMGALTFELVALLTSLPTIYGYVNVKAKTIGRDAVELEGGERG
jgi:hypothetical protein